jgi:hypothetical protein
MKHPDGDALLLAAYGELAPAATDELSAHLQGCGGCRERLAALETPRVALDLTLRPARRRMALRWVVAGLAAAVVVFVVLRASNPPAPAESGDVTIALPRYMAPGLAPIDSLLTRLEQERLYAIP